MEIAAAHREPHLTEVRSLFEEYGSLLQARHGVACMGDFGRELRELPGAYAPPEGRLLLAQVSGHAAGCVSFRRITAETCEMKRLYVRPEMRGRRIGHSLAVALFEEARHEGYQHMCLDTLPTMTEAVALYQALGFLSSAPYSANPTPGALYFRRALQPG
jgi:carbonic anhydrase